MLPVGQFIHPERSLMKVFFTEQMSVESGGYSPSASKPAAAVADWLAHGLAIQICDFDPATESDLCLAHDRHFVRAVLACEKSNGHGNRIPEVTRSRVQQLRFATACSSSAGWLVRAARKNSGSYLWTQRTFRLTATRSPSGRFETVWCIHGKSSGQRSGTLPTASSPCIIIQAVTQRPAIRTSALQNAWSRLRKLSGYRLSITSWSALTRQSAFRNGDLVIAGSVGGNQHQW